MAGNTQRALDLIGLKVTSVAYHTDMDCIVITARQEQKTARSYSIDPFSAL